LESKKKKLLIVSIVFISVGILLISVPFPATETVFERENSTILSGIFYITHTQYPWRSINQLAQVDIEAFNGTFTFLILDEISLSNWIDHLPFYSFYQANNITEIKTTILIEPPYLGQLNFIIIANTTIYYSALIEVHYLNYFTSWGGLSMGIGLAPILYLFILKRKQGRLKKYNQSSQF